MSGGRFDVCISSWDSKRRLLALHDLINADNSFSRRLKLPYLSYTSPWTKHPTSRRRFPSLTPTTSTFMSRKPVSTSQSSLPASPSPTATTIVMQQSSNATASVLLDSDRTIVYGCPDGTNVTDQWVHKAVLAPNLPGSQASGAGCFVSYTFTGELTSALVSAADLGADEGLQVIRCRCSEGVDRWRGCLDAVSIPRRRAGGTRREAQTTSFPTLVSPVRSL